MSIYGSLPGVDDEGEHGPPFVYRGSHVLPHEDDPRRGVIHLAEIPSHITRDGRDNRPEDGAPWPWLRIGIALTPGDDPTVLITPDQARHLAQQLVAWADEAQPEEHP